jgi:hypothetical protein
MTATTTYGRDMSCLRFARRGSIVTGGRLLGEAAYRRLSTERGRLLYARGYGLGLQRMLNSVQSDSDLASWPGQIRAELLKDKRLDTVSVEIASELVSGTARRVTVTIEAFAKNGVDGFGLVLSVDEVSVRLLQLRA